MLILLRSLHEGSCMVLIAVMVFRRMLLGPALRRKGDGSSALACEPVFRNFEKLSLGALALLLASGVSWFFVVAEDMSGEGLVSSWNDGAFTTVLLQTQFGRVSLLRLGLVIALATTWWACRRDHHAFRGSVEAWEIASGLLVLALTLSLAWFSHAAAAAQGPWGVWRLGADVGHLLAASIWPTGLLPFSLFLAFARRTELSASLLDNVVRRFSTISLVVVVALIATGAINSIFALGSFEALIATPYGRVLDLKLFLFVAILGIASYNRHGLLPMIFHSDAAVSRVDLIGRLHRFVLAELGLAVFVLVVTSVLVTTPPPVQ